MEKVLSVIKERERVTQAFLIEKFGFKKSYLSQLISKMENNGFVVKTQATDLKGKYNIIVYNPSEAEKISEEMRSFYDQNGFDKIFDIKLDYDKIFETANKKLQKEMKSFGAYTKRLFDHINK